MYKEEFIAKRGELSKEAIEEFRVLYEEVYGVKLPFKSAEELANHFMELFSITLVY